MKVEHGIVKAVTRFGRAAAGALILGAVLSACSGGGSVNVGSGQTPDPATVDFPIFYVKRNSAAHARFAARFGAPAGMMFDLVHPELFRGKVARLKNGNVVQNTYWNHLFKELPEVRQFQVVIEPTGGLTFLLVGTGFSEAREAGLRRVLEGFLGIQALEFQWVERIPLTAQGKLIQVVHR